MIEDAPYRDTTMNGKDLPASWMSWIGKIRLYAGSVSESGTTAQRPTSNLWVGRMFFDTTLGKPIWLKTTAPVWVDATGATV